MRASAPAWAALAVASAAPCPARAAARPRALRAGAGFFGTVGSTLEGLATGAGSGAVGGRGRGRGGGAQIGGELGQGAGGWVGALAGREIGEIVGEIGLDVILGVIAVPFAAITAAAKAGILEKIAEIEVNASGGEARAKGLSGPTHSELSKDAPEHRLFDASAALARAAADEEIGAKMIDAWNTVESVPGQPQRRRAVVREWSGDAAAVVRRRDRRPTSHRPLQPQPRTRRSPQRRRTSRTSSTSTSATPRPRTGGSRSSCARPPGSAAAPRDPAPHTHASGATRRSAPPSN